MAEIDGLLYFRRELPVQVSWSAAHFLTAALELAQFRSLPRGLVAEIFASGLALNVFEGLTNDGQGDIDQEKVCKFLIFEPLKKALKGRLADFIGETSTALAPGDQRNKRTRTA